MEQGDDAAGAINKLRTMLRDHLAGFPEDYGSAKEAAMNLSRVFHEELAKALAPKLNSHLRRMPLNSHEDYRKLASWCNHELHELHLSIRCPKTGQAAILTADMRRRDPEDDVSRLRLRVRDSASHSVSMTYTSQSLPEFELMEEPIRLEGMYRSATRPQGRQR